jgi:exportin-1
VEERVFIGKLGDIGGNFLKWPLVAVFVPPISSELKDQFFARNNMEILKLLSEEVFDFSRDQMVTEKESSA